MNVPTKPPGLPNSKPPVSKPILTQSGISPASTPRRFSVSEWTGHGEGEKIVVYAKSGMGKTTLASMVPNPIFIGVDDGGRRIRNPKTGEAVRAVTGVSSFADIREVLHQDELFPVGSTIVLDTITKAEALAEQYLFQTVKTERGERVDSIEGYGYGKGYKHLLDAIRLLLSDFEPHVRRGVNVLLIAQEGQATVANLAGADYVQDGPKLSNAAKFSVRTEVCEWVDHVLRIGHPDVQVVKDNKNAIKGKVVGATTRAIYTEPELYFLAKNRMNGTLPPVVSFEEPKDDSIWVNIFGDK